MFVPCRSGNVIAQYGFDSATGQLAAANPPTVQAATGAGPRHIAFHPNQQFAYVINELNGTITSYRYDATAGLLSMPQSMSAVPAGMNETSSAHVVVHPSGKFVYASNRTTQHIAMFTVDPTSGRLTTIGHETGGGMVRRRATSASNRAVGSCSSPTRGRTPCSCSGSSQTPGRSRASAIR